MGSGGVLCYGRRVNKVAANPFTESPLALENSCYCMLEDDELVVDGEPAPRMAAEVHSALRAVLRDPEFPCLGAKSLVNQSSYRFGFYPELGSGEATAGLAHDIARFVDERPSIEGEFSSFIASFSGPKVLTAKGFEEALWQQLARLHETGKPYYRWNAAVSSDPSDPAFSFSFAGQPFFVVGLSPASEHWARSFPWPTLVFNDHFQFERLREEQRFERLRGAIRDRDAALHGEENPMLADYGTHSEARQYAGRKVGPKWKCPVHFDTSEAPDA